MAARAAFVTILALFVPFLVAGRDSLAVVCNPTLLCTALVDLFLV